MEEIKFISHSSISLTVDKKTLLCDPWFFGKAFDNSWCLIEEPNIDDIDYNSIAYIWVSHEHPDHFSIPTLKYLKEKVNDDVVFIYRSQENKDVINFVEKLGYETLEINEGERVQLEGIGYITSYNKRSDTALLIESAENTILNLNDCMLSKAKCKKIIKSVEKIDYLFCQFSIAGYSGNHKNYPLLKELQSEHKARVSDYFNIFTPSYFIPFASFVTFCTPNNHFLNDWRITVEDVSRIIPPSALQIVFNGDSVIDDLNAVMNRNNLNLRKWNDSILHQRVDLTARSSIDDQLLLSTLEDFCTIFDSWPRYSYPDSIIIDLFDKEYGVEINFRKETVKTVYSDQAIYDAAMTSYNLNSFIVNKWGADTLNISGEANVLNVDKWRWFLFCKHYCYKPVSSLHLSKYIPRVYSKVKEFVKEYA